MSYICVLKIDWCDGRESSRFVDRVLQLHWGGLEPRVQASGDHIHRWLAAHAHARRNHEPLEGDLLAQHRSRIYVHKQLRQVQLDSTAVRDTRLWRAQCRREEEDLETVRNFLIYNRIIYRVNGMINFCIYALHNRNRNSVLNKNILSTKSIK